MIVDVLPRARRDIRKAYDRIYKDDPVTANRFLQVIDKTIDLFERNAHVGRPGKTPGVREWSVPNWPYLIPYRIIGQDVEVLRVWHTSKQQPEFWS